MKHRENTQATDILNHLQKRGKITSIECIELYGCTRASLVIMNLRKDHIIETEMQKGINRHGNSCRYGIYVYKGEKTEIKDMKLCWGNDRDYSSTEKFKKASTLITNQPNQVVYKWRVESES